MVTCPFKKFLCCKAKALTPEEHQEIATAVTEAERCTSAEIVAVVAPASDAYHSYVLLMGFFLGSIISINLWSMKALTDFPSFLVIQLAAMSLLSFVTPLRHLCIRLVPQRALHHRPARRAFEEYVTISENIPPEVPLVMLYVSLAERYVHILSNRAVHEKLPNEHWTTLIGEFTQSMSAKTVGAACVQAVGRIADVLVPHFPDNGEKNRVGDVREIKE